jgi:hypothetical protein
MYLPLPLLSYRSRVVPFRVSYFVLVAGLTLGEGDAAGEGLAAGLGLFAGGAAVSPAGEDDVAGDVVLAGEFVLAAGSQAVTNAIARIVVRRSMI